MAFGELVFALELLFLILPFLSPAFIISWPTGGCNEEVYCVHQTLLLLASGADWLSCSNWINRHR